MPREKEKKRKRPRSLYLNRFSSTREKKKRRAGSTPPRGSPGKKREIALPLFNAERDAGEFSEKN